MLSRYKKQDAPPWQRKLVILLWSLCGATFLLFTVWAIMLFVDSARLDDCLDQGGRYDYESGECDTEADYRVPNNQGRAV